jgi:hypothetical protein
MKKELIYILASICFLSCQTRKDYEDMAIRASKQIDSSACKNDFWNFEIFSRGDRGSIFYDNSRRIITTLTDSTFSVDTIIIYDEQIFYLPFTGLQTMEIEQMENIARCFKEIDIQKIRGY